MGELTPKAKKAKMKKGAEANYMRLALGMSGIAVSTQVADLIVTMHKGIEQKGDLFSIRDASRIEAMIEEKYKAKEGGD